MILCEERISWRNLLNLCCTDFELRCLYFWVQGKIDDVIKADGERVGPFEVESKPVENLAAAVYR